MTEIEIIKAIQLQLQSEIPEYGNEPEPPDLTKYHLLAPEGVILIKSIRLGNTYTNRGMSITKDFNYLSDYNYRLTLIDRDISSYTRLYELSERVRQAMRAIKLGNSSAFYLISQDEPELINDKGFLVRNQLYLFPVQNILE